MCVLCHVYVHVLYSCPCRDAQEGIRLLFYHSEPYSPEARSCIEPGARLEASKPLRSSDLSLVHSPGVTGNSANTLIYLCEARALNSGPQACAARALGHLAISPALKQLCLCPTAILNYSDLLAFNKHT